MEREIVSERETGWSGTLGGAATMSGLTKPDVRRVTLPAAAVQWSGYGTDVKPAFEPLIVARKALDGTVAHNVTTHGCGALNIDAARIGTTGGTRKGTFPNGDSNGVCGDGLNGGCEIVSTGKGRFPAALALVQTARETGTESIATPMRVLEALANAARSE